MDHFRPAFFVLLGLVAAVAAQDEAEDLKRLAGRWTVVSAEESEAQIKEAVGTRFVIHGNLLWWEIPALEEEKERLRLDPTQKPKHIDIELSRDEIARGIYALDGDTLKLCLPTAETEGRPREFAAKKGRAVRLLVLKRGPAK